ncbi:GNAT family N-acetyltransferase [Spongorhabdus nitratireducens]
MLTIRKYKQSEASELWNIFFNTIRRINSRDYTEAQVRAWAPDTFDETAWQQRMAAIDPFVALTDNKIAGYADIQPDGYIDHFFCHADYQGRGIGSALMQHILATAEVN